MQREKKEDALLPGSITKEEISTIMNTGVTTVWMEAEF